MKKQILNLGKALSKAEQKTVFGGKATLTHAPVDGGIGCGPDFPCPTMGAVVDEGEEAGKWITYKGVCTDGYCH